MNSGKLRHRIMIESKQNEFNEYREMTETWTEYGTRWAEVVALNAKEIQSNPQLKSFITHRIRMRYLDGVTNAMRVKFKDKYFNIIECLPDTTDKKFQNLLCVGAV